MGLLKRLCSVSHAMMPRVNASPSPSTPHTFTRGIIAWLTEHKRFNSPIYLYGESYGTMRNAVVYRLLGEHGIGVTGVVEQSTILDYAPTLSGNDGCRPARPGSRTS